MNIVVLGAGFRNKGNEAMLRVVQKELNQRIDGGQIFAVLPPGEESALAYASGVVPSHVENIKVCRYLGSRIARMTSVSQFLLRTGSMVQLARSIVHSQHVLFKAQPRIIDQAIGGIDAVVDIHGYAFGDPWSLEGFEEAAAWGEFCLRRDKPYCFLPQSWGSFEKTGYAEATARILQKASLFYAREELSQAELAKALQRPLDDILIAPDTVFRFGSGPSSFGEEVLRRIGLHRSDKPLIGISPNMRVYERTAGMGSGNEYVRLLLRLCDYCIENLRADVVLIPNEINPLGYERRDDRFLCNLIASMVRQPAGCFAFREYHSAEEIRSAIVCLDLLIGSRFHTLIFALSAGVPLIALGWAHKYDGLLRQFGLNSFFRHYSQFVENRILELVNLAWEARNSTAQTIRSVLPWIQTQVDAVFDSVAQVLCQKRQ